MIVGGGLGNLWAVNSGFWRQLPLRLLDANFGSRPSYGIAQFAFTRGLGVIYLIAIWSWWGQIDGLIGSRGVSPVAEYLVAFEGAMEREGKSGFWNLPTVFHLNASDPALHWGCLIGVVLACLVVAGVFQGPCLLLLWFVYLSLSNTGSVFMNFQWDALLLEAGLLGVLAAPWRPWVGWRMIFPFVSRWAVFLVWVLLFKLMFLSGLVKVIRTHAGEDLSGNTWLDGTALTYHYETQPLPHGLSWYAHQLPDWFQAASLWVMFVIEIGLPFLIFLGRWPRLIAFVGLVGLQVLIIGTGNYTYFNYLTILLCLMLLDDRQWPKWVRERWLWPEGRMAGPGWLMDGAEVERGFAAVECRGRCCSC